MRRFFLTCATVILFLFIGSSASAQVACPPNIDFEQGLGNWTYYTGVCCPINTPSLTGPLANRHVLTSGNGVDPYGNFPVVSPNGGTKSLKIGNNSTGSQAERARYTFTVPAGVNNYSLIYRYAVVFEDPSHQIQEQPRFEVKAFNVATNAIIPCSQRTYVASSNLPGFALSGVGQDVWYLPWSSGTINLSGYAGQTIAIDFATGDCDLGAHFGYGYVDMNCSLFQISANNCVASPTTTLTGPPGYQSYQWTNANYTTTVGTGQILTIPTPPVTTVYHLILTPFNGLGCPDTLTSTVSVTAISLNPTNDTVICTANGGITLNAGATSTAPPISYVWTPSDNLSCTTCANPVATPTVDKTYYITAIDANGCSATDSVKVRADNLQRSVASHNVLCYGASTGSATATVSGGMGSPGYAWNTIPVQNTLVASNLPIGTYTFTVADSFCTLSSPVTISEPSQLNASLSSTNVSCNGGSNGTMAALVTGGVQPYSYSWSSMPSSNTPNVTNLLSGNYLLTVIDSNGCMDTASMLITQPPQLNVTISPVTHVACFGGPNGSATALPSGGTSPYSIAWNTTPVQTTGTAVNLAAGSYTVQLTDGKGCVDTAQVTITQPPVLAATVSSIVPVTCATASNGSATVAPSGGTAPYSYSWNTMPLQTTATASNLTIGTYTATISDSHGCTTSLPAAVTYPNPLLATIPSVSPINCFGDSTGVATVSPSGGFPPYKYLWNTTPSQSGATASGLPMGNYIVTVTDSTGCSVVANVSITQQPEILVSTVSVPTCVFTSAGTASASVSGGVSPYAYSWNSTPSQSGTVAANVPAGTYTILVTDAKGCTRTSSILVTNYPKALVNARGDTLLCEGSPVKLTATGSVNYSWSPSGSLSCSACPSPFANPSQTTTYKVIGTDINNCSDTDDVTITVLHPVPVKVGPPAEICENQPITLFASGGGTYQWSPSEYLSNDHIASPKASPPTTTTYQVIITENECFSDTFHQTVVVEPNPTISLGPDIKALPGAVVYLKADTAHAVSVKWTPPTNLNCNECDNPTAKVDKVITYTAEVFNRLGCKTTDIIDIIVGCDQSSFLIPNTFTPNGDGLNDVFYPKGRSIATVNFFMIYNRWGELLYERKDFPANDATYGWNGTFKAAPMKTDVYVYMLEGTCGNGERILLKGDITLYR